MKPFTPEEFVAWAEACLSEPPEREYTLKPGEFTTRTYWQALGGACDIGQASKRLRLLVTMGKATRRRELVNRKSSWVYTPVEDAK